MYKPQTIDRPIAIAVIVFLALLAGFYLTLPKYRQFRDLQTELSKKEAEYQSKAAYFSQVNYTLREIKKDPETLTKIDTALPEKFSLASLIYFLQKKTAENGLILKKATLTRASAAGTGSALKEASFSLELLGSYASLKNFLSALEKSSRLIEVGDISFSSREKFQQTYSFNMIIKVNSY